MNIDWTVIKYTLLGNIMHVTFFNYFFSQDTRYWTFKYISHLNYKLDSPLWQHYFLQNFQLYPSCTWGSVGCWGWEYFQGVTEVLLGDLHFDLNWVLGDKRLVTYIYITKECAKFQSYPILFSYFMPRTIEQCIFWCEQD